MKKWQYRFCELYKIDYGFLIQWHINLCGLFNARFIVEEQQ